MSKFKIYRNLHKNCFSVLKYVKEKKGYRLHEHITDAVLYDVETKVSETGRQKVIREKQKNVHAFLLCSHYTPLSEPLNTSDYTEVYYNPYKQSSFTANNQPIQSCSSLILTTQPKPTAFIFNKNL